MDEIDWIKSIKKALIVFSKIFGGFGIAWGVISLLAIPINEWEVKKVFLFVALLIAFALPLVLYLGYLALSIVEKIINSGRVVINFDKEYIRDLPKHCSPAIASMVYDLKIDVYKDYTATLLYLYTKKYIDIEKVEDKYKIILGKNNEYSNLGECEKYVLDVIKSTKEFDASNFEQIIVNEVQEKNLLTDKKYSKIPSIILLSIIALILFFITYEINLILFLIYTTVLFIAVAGYGLININERKIKYKRTKEGKNIALILKALKRYIREYTLIKDKEIDYIQILENYIPYSLALGEADTVEEFIKNNEEYRDLIYNRRSMQ